MKTASLPPQTMPANLADVASENARLNQENEALKRRVAWFEKQLFGQKSEKRQPIDNALQLGLLSGAQMPQTAPEGESTTVTYQRGKGKKVRPDDCVNDSGLRFGENVPVKVIIHTPDELKGDDADQYEVIGTKSTFRLAQRPASYVVLRYDRLVLKRKHDNALLPCPAPFNVLDKSLADVSLLAGLLVDKFQYHLPLYRQHQRLTDSGVTLSRATLTTLTKRAIELLTPITHAQLDSVLQSQVLAMDETPIKAARAGPGKLKQSWFWPLYGDKDEVNFTFSSSRGRQHVEKTLRTRFNGTLLSDGYSAYASYVQANEELTHAQCWAHSRRKFIEAEAAHPAAAQEALALIATLYRVEADGEAQQRDATQMREYRLRHAKPIVDSFFDWALLQLERQTLTPKDPLLKAIGYVRAREVELRVFLENPAVQLDTNHLERALRPIPMGRRNWLFCWTELGAEHVGIIQSLIATCRLQEINPYTYLTDVLLRVSQHPASKVAQLTPRLWKAHFASDPLTSDLFEPQSTTNSPLQE